MQRKNAEATTTTKSFVVVSMNEVFKQLETNNKRWKEEKRVGRVSYDAKCDAIAFHFDEKTPAYRYWLPFSQVQTPDGQMRWLNHIRHKGWFDRQTMNDFLDCLERLGVAATLKDKAKPKAA